MSARAVLALALSLACGACGYTAGFKPAGGVRTIAVPIFENRTLRRELEFPMTEAVVREIQRRTPLAVTSAEKADLVLRGEIERFDQTVLVEGPNDEVLESGAVIALGVSATDRRSGRTVFRYAGPAPTPGATGPALVESAQFSNVNQEGVGSATAEAFRELAERVVMLLEAEMARPPNKSP